MWAWRGKTEEAGSQIRERWRRPGNPLINRMDARTSPARIASIYRYPVKGLTPEPLSRADTQARPDAAGRPPLRHRERSLRLRSRRAEWMPKPHFLMLMRDEWLAALHTQFDDASQRPLDPPQRRDRGPGQSRNGRGPGRRSRPSSPRLCRPDQGSAEGAGKPRPQFFGRRPQGRLDHQSRQPPRHREHGGRAGPSAALPRQPLCRGLAGLARIRSARPHAGHRRRATEGGEAHRPLRRRQCRSGHRRSATSPSRRRCSAGSATPIAGSMPR